MARCLIVGCGCRGRSLARELVERGHVVRGTTRERGNLGEIERIGVEAVLADPDRMATLAPALDHVSVVILLLGTATGTGERIEALHGSRLEMLMTKVLDTTIRGVVYEAAGSVPGEVLDAAAGRLGDLCRTSRIPHALITATPGSDGWLADAVVAVDAVLAG